MNSAARLTQSVRVNISPQPVHLCPNRLKRYLLNIAFGLCLNSYNAIIHKLVLVIELVHNTKPNRYNGNVPSYTSMFSLSQALRAVSEKCVENKVK